MSLPGAAIDRGGVWIPVARRALVRGMRAFTVSELAIAFAILAILLAMAVPSYQSYRQQVNVAVATRDIGQIYSRIESYIALHHNPPPNLAAVGEDQVLDPWGRPYVYLSFQSLNAKGQTRKDKNLAPINTQFDLYSSGADGRSVPPLTAKVSQDDVILAKDGAYIGLASSY